MLFASSIGKKVIMGVTGLMMVGWVLMHMFGNTLLFAGSEPLPFTDMSAMNFYGWILQEGSHGAIWGMRAIMLTAMGLHVWAAVTLTQQNSAARPVAYQHGKKTQKTSIFALTMRYSGVLLLLYIIGHVAHITVGLGVPNFEFGHPYETVVSAFQNPIVAVVYMLANVALAFHLFHATWSSLETLGFDHPQYNGARKALSVGIALLIGVVNVSFPLAVLLGVIA
jgi:succinate dehydrogenase / fumarate reductase, cytochrome b subunit